MITRSIYMKYNGELKINNNYNNVFTLVCKNNQNIHITYL